jgi:hypothetical protein
MSGSRSEAQQDRQQSQGQRQQSSSENQAQRQASASQNQGARQSTATQAQNTRASTVSNVQGNYQGGNCYNCSNWDNGSAAAGFVAGAAVVGATAAATRPTTVLAAAPAPAAPPCNIAPVPVSGVPYYRCGGTWYTAGYASEGVVYMPVAPPPGY